MFKFSLQRILELKARKEQAAATELARVRADADEARLVCETLADTREAGVTQRMTSGAPTVGELRTAGLLLQRLDEQIHQARAEVTQAEGRVAATLDHFTAASQERRVLDRLRDRQLTAWQAEQVQDDRKTMDNIALSRFTQRSATLELEEDR